MVGMGAMVGSGTGAAMMAVTMIFEMTRNYDIVLPMILAVAVSIGIRRVLSRENIYTLKLVRRGHAIRAACTPTCSWCAAARDVMDARCRHPRRSDDFRRVARKRRRALAACATSW